jgi:hypothetical protein
MRLGQALQLQELGNDARARLAQRGGVDGAGVEPEGVGHPFVERQKAEGLRAQRRALLHGAPRPQRPRALVPEGGLTAGPRGFAVVDGEAAQRAAARARQPQQHDPPPAARLQ